MQENTTQLDDFELNSNLMGFDGNNFTDGIPYDNDNDNGKIVQGTTCNLPQPLKDVFDFELQAFHIQSELNEFDLSIIDGFTNDYDNNNDIDNLNDNNNDNDNDNGEIVQGTTCNLPQPLEMQAPKIKSPSKKTKKSNWWPCKFCGNPHFGRTADYYSKHLNNLHTKCKLLLDEGNPTYMNILKDLFKSVQMEMVDETDADGSPIKMRRTEDEVVYIDSPSPSSPNTKSSKSSASTPYNKGNKSVQMEKVEETNADGSSRKMRRTKDEVVYIDSPSPSSPFIKSSKSSALTQYNKGNSNKHSKSTATTPNNKNNGKSLLSSNSMSNSGALQYNLNRLNIINTNMHTDNLDNILREQWPTQFKINYYLLINKMTYICEDKMYRNIYEILAYALNDETTTTDLLRENINRTLSNSFPNISEFTDVHVLNAFRMLYQKSVVLFEWIDISLHVAADSERLDIAMVKYVNKETNKIQYHLLKNR